MNSASNSWSTCEVPHSAESTELDHYRLLSRDDPAAFIRYCLIDPAGRFLKCGKVHDELQDFLTAHRLALIELPRDHGKSTQVCGRILWELGKNPALRVKIICATDEIARERSRFLRRAIKHNGRVRDVFPRLRPAEPWTAKAFTVKRPAEVIGHSVAALGIGSGSTGTRADLLVCDDVVDVRSLHSKAARERVADYFANNLMNLLEPDGRFWGLFTPWHRDDLNARLKKNGAYALFSRAVGADFEPVWPERWPADALRARKEEIGSASFSRGYRLQSVADEDTPIRASWIRFWSAAVPSPWSAGVSPASESGTSGPASCGGSRRAFERLAGETPALQYDQVDPRRRPRRLDRGASGSQRARCAGKAPLRPAASPAGRAARTKPPSPLRGGGLGGEVKCTSSPPGPRGSRRRNSSTSSMPMIDSGTRRSSSSSRTRRSRGLRDLLVRTTRFGPKLKAVTQTTDKAARVAALSVPVENGAFRLKGNAAGDGPDESQRELWEEMAGFPYADTDDLVDAAATGCAYLLTQREPTIW